MRKLSVVFIVLFGLFFTSASQSEAFGSGGQLIIINKKTNTLAFYDNGKLVRKFNVATGRTRSLTPEGTFMIVNKIVNRPYYKKKIPGGDPRNPLGNRWLGINARGTYGTTYAIHGNSNENSIGRYVSSGCVRMHNAEVRWLFSRVNNHTPVIITYSSSSFDSIARAHMDGWQVFSGKKYYYANGKAQTGWQTINGKKYYFNEKGVMQTGWVTSGKNKYFLDQNGVMQTGWNQVGGEKYYFDEPGAAKTGWLTDAGKRYYFAKDGVLMTGWIENNGQKYYFDKDGTMRTGWVEDADKWYYFDHYGMMKTGWVNSEGKWYYLNNSGFIENAWFGEESSPVIASAADSNQNEWFTISGERYYFKSNPSTVASLLKYENTWYYLYVSADMAAASSQDQPNMETVATAAAEE
ncbi:L,D-transpeptidase family protein [Neobacillus mesonae]|uniref:L,D-transpeptidase family protein n=1 Tax=Neobacillus mesonae TaxID=1193713 RepID=UPI00203C3B57|nr:L,D-transpeptidase family protein [Neobacillus mesonae]MCM3567087.1 L,D-transpeptidase family protein [Neobacillus mesonae]